MKLIWKRQAYADRANIMQYIGQDNPAAALTLDALLSDQAASLLDNPKLGRAGRVNGTREFVAHPNYLLVYQVQGDTVTVLRVLHSAQRYSKAAVN